VVSWEDKPLMLCSLACFISFITYGASMATLGASVPELASRFDKQVSQFSVAFAFRGALRLGRGGEGVCCDVM